MIWEDMAIVGRIARAHGNRGQVILNLETDFPIDMAARWSSRHVEGKIGNGGRRIRFNTGNGHVRIRKIG